MKRVLTVSLLMGIFLTTADAQTYSYKPTGTLADTRVVIKNFFADILIEGTSASEMVIETSDYEGVPERAKGLKPLSATGPENTGIGLSVVQEGNDVVISAASRNANDGDYVLRLPKGMKVMADLSSWQAGDFTVSGMTGEIEVKSHSGDLILKNITGPVVAYSLSGDIEATFASLNQATPTSISTTSGDIDVTVPTSTKGNFQMKSVSGEIYTDLDFKFSNDEDLKRFGGGMSASSALNGGGVEIALKTVSGDVFIRKAE